MSESFLAACVCLLSGCLVHPTAVSCISDLCRRSAAKVSDVSVYTFRFRNPANCWAHTYNPGKRRSLKLTISLTNGTETNENSPRFPSRRLNFVTNDPPKKVRICYDLACPRTLTDLFVEPTGGGVNAVLEYFFAVLEGSRFFSLQIDRITHRQACSVRYLGVSGNGAAVLHHHQGCGAGAAARLVHIVHSFRLIIRLTSKNVRANITSAVKCLSFLFRSLVDRHSFLLLVRVTAGYFLFTYIRSQQLLLLRLFRWFCLFPSQLA